MSLPFGDDYAGLYDRFYAEKKYAAECDLVEAAARRFGAPGGKRLLDVGCGTGSHAIELARRGWSVTGVDRSPAMLREARAKAEREHAAIRFVESDARAFDAGGPFDVALMMFAVIGYLGDDAGAALANVRRHLAPGALFLFDCWYGPAVLKQRPGQRVLTVGETSRYARASLDEARQLVSVDYRVVGAGGAGTRELHTMRYFFAGELRSLLDTAGFELLSLTAFPSLDEAITDDDWNAFAVARARE
jgi:SAM-dependent methyltransferase